MELMSSARCFDESSRAVIEITDADHADALLGAIQGLPGEFVETNEIDLEAGTILRSFFSGPKDAADVLRRHGRLLSSADIRALAGACSDGCP